jgi:hypothetical protein
MSNQNIDYMNRLLEQIRTEVQDMEFYHNTEVCRKDHDSVTHQINAAYQEANRIEATQIEEIADVKPLHDRIHAIAPSLRVARNNLERLRGSRRDCLSTSARQISHTVEEPYDDHEL